MWYSTLSVSCLIKKTTNNRHNRKWDLRHNELMKPLNFPPNLRPLLSEIITRHGEFLFADSWGVRWNTKCADFHKSGDFLKRFLQLFTSLCPGEWKCNWRWFYLKVPCWSHLVRRAEMHRVLHFFLKLSDIFWILFWDPLATMYLRLKVLIVKTYN